MLQTFHLILIKPTHYDDDGYPIQWVRSFIPSNSLACVYGIAADACDRQVLGPDVSVDIQTFDETNATVPVNRLIRQIRRDGGRALVCMVGVQSNQFPRAIDLSQPFLEAGIQVCLGGFHVAGCLSMLPEMPPEMVAAQEQGISFFAGEAEEGRLDQVLRDAWDGRLKPIYNHLADMPGLEGAATPILRQSDIKRTAGSVSSFDLGRGCPYQCSFCTIINVQGRKSRFRSADDLEVILRENAAQGIRHFFLTDDNLARNRNWEACFDRLIELRHQHGLKVSLTVQVDTLCHKIPGFIDKACAAGVGEVFVGMENINSDNLLLVQKRQNKITDYREMLLAWKKYPVMITAGYILGFPNDTYDSILRDVDIIKRELPLDNIYFTNLTPLPGCADHLALWRKGVWMDPDLNKFDLNHRVTHHEKMSDEEWDRVYKDVWARFYTWEHMETILKRMTALGSNKRYTTIKYLTMFRDYRRLHSVHPLEGGFFRVKDRTQRRPGFARESWPVFYAKYAWFSLRTSWAIVQTYRRLLKMMKTIRNDPASASYMDAAITPPTEGEVDDLALYQDTRGGVEAVEKMRRMNAGRDKLKAAKREGAGEDAVDPATVAAE